MTVGSERFALVGLGLEIICKAVMRLSGATKQSLSRPPPANFLDADVEAGAAWAKWERMVEGKRRV